MVIGAATIKNPRVKGVREAGGRGTPHGYGWPVLGTMMTTHGMHDESLKLMYLFVSMGINAGITTSHQSQQLFRPVGKEKATR